MSSAKARLCAWTPSWATPSPHMLEWLTGEIDVPILVVIPVNRSRHGHVDCFPPAPGLRVIIPGCCTVTDLPMLRQVQGRNISDMHQPHNRNERCK